MGKSYLVNGIFATKSALKGSVRPNCAAVCGKILAIATRANIGFSCLRLGHNGFNAILLSILKRCFFAVKAQLYLRLRIV